MGKKIIVALIGIDKSQVPLDLADEQWIDLTSGPQAYRRLKEGLKRAGLDALSFPFEAGRRPYPGFAYLEEKDAAVFFRRDAQIVRGLDEIRRLVRTGVSRMLVILGASGSGKSSFLRAGLWPRLKRDDRTWLPLPIIRPERAVISGTYGLAQALADNELSLSGYDRLGGLKGVIDTAVKQAFAEGVAKGDVPRDVKAQLALARAAFIPHLAQVNPGGQFVRRVAARDQIPAGARPLIDRFADQRLLIRDRRQDAEVIEVAHEALLRQPPFSEWLEEDREFLMWRERLSQARAAFAANERGLLAGRELQIARGWVQTRAKNAIDPADQAFIDESIAEDDKRRADEAEQERKRQAAEKEEQERRTRDAERIAAARRRTAQVSFAGFVVAVLVAAAAVAEYFAADRAKMTAETERDRGTQARDLAVFSVDTAKQIAGPVSGQLLRLTETAQAAINVTSPLDSEFAYLDIARYYVAAWQNEQAKMDCKKLMNIPNTLCFPTTPIEDLNGSEY
jgi:hypothetical protein